MGMCLTFIPPCERLSKTSTRKTLKPYQEVEPLTLANYGEVLYWYQFIDDATPNEPEDDEEEEEEEESWDCTYRKDNPIEL